MQRLWPSFSLVHVKIQARNYLSSSPKIAPGVALLKVSNKLMIVKTQDDCGVWLLSFKAWCDEYQSYVKEKSYNAMYTRI